MLIFHVETSPYDERANYGVKIRYGIFDVGAKLATDARELYESVFTRKRKILFTFDQSDRHKMVCFCLRYENSKGKAGQWSDIVSAIIA